MGKWKMGRKKISTNNCIVFFLFVSLDFLSSQRSRLTDLINSDYGYVLLSICHKTTPEPIKILNEAVLVHSDALLNFVAGVNQRF